MRRIAIATVAALSLGVGAQAAEHEIRMLTAENGEMLFEPDFVQAAPGDTIRFIPTDPGHNAETIRGMIPDGAEAFKGEIGEGITVTLTEEGVYGIMCKSHHAMGMVALVVVGEPANLEQAMKRPHPLKARSVFKKHFDTLLSD